MPIATEINGIIIGDSINNSINFFPLKLYIVKEYAAGIVIKMVIKDTIIAIIKLFVIVFKFSLFKIYSIPLNEYSLGINFGYIQELVNPHIASIIIGTNILSIAKYITNFLNLLLIKTPIL
ncbi:hypothetical protein SDC9_98829 [bioreactor metagenome]|uniref:Uncharacterized protein n=1 Tax=bioreactor metagenome TaxID=1076179 RepID=A0A645AGJ6_9ZZZZ